MKKVTALLLTVGMVFSLVGCNSDKKEDPAPTTAPAATEAPKATEEPKATEPVAAEPVDITMWCIAVESDSNRKAYEDAVADLKAAHPEVNFTWDATQNQDYKPKLKAAAAADELPDIFFTWGMGFLKEFVDAGRIYCLQDEYEANYKGQMAESMLGNHSFDGKLYAVPYYFNIVGLFANMDLLAQVGYDHIPTTYEELTACCDALLAKGISPFGCSGKEQWAVSEYFEPMVVKSVGAQTLKDFYTKTTPWANDKFYSAVDKLQEMVSKGYFDPASAALTNDEVKANFMADKYAFYQNGTWNIADFALNGVTAKMQVGQFPELTPGENAVIGGSNDALAVSASCENPEVAAKLCFELAKNLSRRGDEGGNGIPVFTPDYVVEGKDPLALAVSDIVANASGSVLFGDNFLSAENQGIYLDYVMQAYGNVINSKDCAAGLDADLQ